MTRKFIVPFILLSCFANGQEKLGIVNSNYSSTNSIFLNPSSSADSRTYLQVKIVGLNVYGTTNVGYQPGFSVWALRNGTLPEPVAKNNQRNKFGLAAGSVEGPCAVFTKNNFGVGLFVRARSVVNIRRLPYQITSLILAIEPLSTNAFDMDVHNAGFNHMSWAEVGGNFSYLIKKKGPNMMSIGMNASYLMGYNLVYANMHSMRGIYTDTLIGVQDIEGKMVQSSPKFINGKGFGVDFGFTYKKMLRNVDVYLAHSIRSKCRWIDYKYKIGLTLRDLGYIKFNNQVTTRKISGEGYINLHQTGNDINLMPTINLNVEEKHNPVRAMLPLTFMGQFDYNFENYVYIAAVVTKNFVPATVTGVQGPDLFAVIPRFESKNVEVSLPVTFIHYIRPQLGFAFRIRTFVFGVDNVLPLVIRSNVSTFGVYASVGFSIFKYSGCNYKGGNVDDCQPRPKMKGQRKPGVIKRMLSRGKTYSK